MAAKNLLIGKTIKKIVFLGMGIAICSLSTWGAASDDPLHHPLDAHLSDTYTDDLPGLLERKYLRVLTTMNRTNFFLVGGKAHGYEYALIKEYEKHLNKNIKGRELRMTLEFIPVPRDRVLPDLVNGFGDIAAAGLTVTPERGKIVDFTQPYLTGDVAKKIIDFQPYFERYGRQYRFDWRLILAMAFQESELNPKKKSHRGAVGLMQVRPSTAADPKVAITNIDTVENNIHAGVKYLAFLRDRYFSDDEIRPRDRVRFSLAAYNAGPATIRRARNMAVQMNLDANQWFRNCELAVLRIAGRETVQYVSNINKYYVIYKNALERRESREKTMETIQ